MNTRILKKLGQKLKFYRKNADFTQEYLAEQVGVHPTYIGKLESGKNNPSFMLLYKMSNALSISLKELLDL